MICLVCHQFSVSAIICHDCLSLWDPLVRCNQCGYRSLKSARQHRCEDSRNLDLRLYSCYRSSSEVNQFIAKRSLSPMALSEWIAIEFLKLIDKLGVDCVVPMKGTMFEANALVADYLALKLKVKFSYDVMQGPQLWVDMVLTSEAVSKLMAFPESHLIVLSEFIADRC